MMEETPPIITVDEAAGLDLQALDRQIATAVLGQDLTTQEGRHQSRASAEVHKEMLRRAIFGDRVRAAAQRTPETPNRRERRARAAIARRRG